MKLDWAALAWSTFFVRLFWTVVGSCVVVASLVAASRIDSWGWLQDQAKSTLESLTTVVGPGYFLILCALTLFLLYLVVSGSAILDLAANWLLRPAMEFCKEAACLGCGIWISLSITLQQPAAQSATSAAYLAVVAVSLHASNTIVRAYATPSDSPNGISLKRRRAVAVLAAVGLVAVIYAFKQKSG